MRASPARPPVARRHRAATLALAVGAACAVLAGCASAPRGTSGVFGGPATLERDGPDARPPPDLALVPDAEPRLEPIRIGGPNKPYVVWGQDYVPLTQDTPLTQRGLASWYGRKFSGKPTASGEIYNMYAMTAAHPTLPIPSYARIRNLNNNREVVVRINDRGPFHSTRIVDVSYTAALKLDILRGVTPVEIERITADDIRTGAWRHPDGLPVMARARPPDEGDGRAPPATATATAVAVAATAVVLAETSTAAASLTAAAPAATAPPTAGTAAPDPVASPTVLGPSAAVPTVSTLAAAELAPPVVAPAIQNGAAARALTAPARGFWIQLGAFRQHDGAIGLQQQVEADAEWVTPLLTVFGGADLFRVQAGPYSSREHAREAAERLRTALRLVPLIVERR